MPKPKEQKNNCCGGGCGDVNCEHCRAFNWRKKSPKKEKVSDTTPTEWWKKEFREYFDKILKPKKPTIKNLDREILVDFIRKIQAKSEAEGYERGKSEENERVWQKVYKARANKYGSNQDYNKGLDDGLMMACSIIHEKEDKIGEELSK